MQMNPASSHTLLYIEAQMPIPHFSGCSMQIRP